MNGTLPGDAHDGWFAIGVHALALLARMPDTTSSAYVAASVNTHVVSLRRVVVRLVRAGLVRSQEGRDGGYFLARPADQITLADVYRALRAAGPLPPSRAVPNSQCPVGSGIRAALGEVRRRRTAPARRSRGAHHRRGRRARRCPRCAPRPGLITDASPWRPAPAPSAHTGPETSPREQNHQQSRRPQRA
ncbi:MAG: Rrf2 family transcriptional regulator [Chloroflexota bacterium]